MSRIQEFIDESLVISGDSLKQAVPLLEHALQQIARMNVELHDYLIDGGDDIFEERLNNFQFGSMERVRIELALEQTKKVIGYIGELQKENESTT